MNLFVRCSAGHHSRGLGPQVGANVNRRDSIRQDMGDDVKYTLWMDLVNYWECDLYTKVPEGRYDGYPSPDVEVSERSGCGHADDSRRADCCD